MKQRSKTITNEQNPFLYIHIVGIQRYKIMTLQILNLLISKDVFIIEKYPNL